MAEILVRSSFAAALVAAALPAQYALHESRGPLSGAAVVVALDGGVFGTDAVARAHRNGMQSGALQPLPPGTPNLATILAGTAPAGLDVDDWSLGRDDVMFNAAGVAAVPASSWAVLSFSLRHAATGGVAGSRIAQEAALGSLGSALFSWTYFGSALPSQLVDRTERSHSRQELGLPSTSTADVDAIDFPAMLGRDQQNLIGEEPGWVALDPYPRAIYFTVSHATRGLVPPAWWGGVGPTLPSGATILCVSKASASAPWTQPTVWKHWFELGLLQNDDIDGLAVDIARSRVLFSCAGFTQVDQFMVVDLSTDGAPQPQPATKPGGQRVSTSVGAAGNDDVDAICTLDPQIGSSGNPPGGVDDFGSSCGTPRPGLLGVPSVHGAAYRRFEGGRFFDATIVGWPPVLGAGPGYAALFATVGDAVDLIPLGPVHVRNPASAIPGNPITWPWAIPPSYVLSGQRITLRWAAADQALTEIAEAWPVQVWL